VEQAFQACGKTAGDEALAAAVYACGAMQIHVFALLAIHYQPSRFVFENQPQRLKPLLQQAQPQAWKACSTLSCPGSSLLVCWLKSGSHPVT
jgi:hypothetical protein